MMVDVNGGVTVTEAILGRSSAKKFSERLPTRAEVEELLRAAVRALPTHPALSSVLEPGLVALG